MTVAHSVYGPTADEILRAQEEPGVEFVNGQLVEKPLSNISSVVGVRIITYLQMEAMETKEAIVYDQTMGYQCFPDEPDRFRKPDVSLVRAERLKSLPEEFGMMPIPADLAVEVNSPNDLASAVLEKVDEYLEAGFKLIWVVDPPSQSVTIYRADHSTTRLFADDEITGEAALPTFKCKVVEFFP